MYTYIYTYIYIYIQIYSINISWCDMMMHLISLGRKKGSSTTRPGLDLAPSVPRWSFRSWTRSLSRTSGPTKCSRQVIKLWFPMVSSDFLWCLLMGRKTTLIIWKKTCSHIFWRKKRHWKRGYLGIFQIPILLLEFQGLIPFSNLAPQGRLRCGGRHRSPPRPQRPQRPQLRIWRTQLVTVSSCNFFNSPSKWSFSTNAAWSKSHQIPKLHGCICSMNKIKINTAWSASPPEAKLSWLQIHGISWDIQWFNYLMVCPCKPKFQESRKLRPQTGDDSCPVTENPTPMDLGISPQFKSS